MSSPKPTLLDRTIAHFAPQAGFKRLKARMAWNMLSPVKSTAGSASGSIGNWIVRFLSRFNEGEHHSRSTARAQDLVNNDAHAASVIDSMAMNIVGTGIQPQSRPKADKLGWSEEQTRQFQQQAEWIYRKWNPYADARGMLSFDELQFLTIRSMLTNGEYFRIPIMKQGRNRPLGLAFQGLSPFRVATPSDYQTDYMVRQGIRLDPNGAPRRFYVYDPPPEVQMPATQTGPTGFSTQYFKTFPAWLSPRRPGMMHGFVQKEEEQIRGVSVLAPAMKMFKDLSDYLDFELVGAIVASSFPVFVETQNPKEAAEVYETEGDEEEEKTRYQEVSPGQMMYGNTGEKPHILSPERPSNTFSDFVKRNLQAQSASVGVPYEVIAKDFSQTTYSSAKAALNEADRTYRTYRQHFIAQFLQPTWGMVLEEAWLRGELELPEGSPDFYEAYDEITRAAWIPPKKGHIEPVKETQADVKAIKEGTKTFSQAIQEQGGDWETHLEQRKREQDKIEELGLQLGEKKQG